jgi:N utilization substance protein B
MSLPGASETAPAGPRGLARLCAVQALYQIEISGAEYKPVIDEFIGFRMSGGIEESPDCVADSEFFRDVVSGVDARDAEIAEAVGAALSESWSYQRLDTTLRQILRAATYELIARIDVPARVIINEYVELAGAFFEGPEPGFVNAVLDRLGRVFRSGEMIPDQISTVESEQT